MNNEIVLYQSDELRTRLEVKLEDESVWLSQQQIVQLFGSSKSNISEHIKNVFLSGELNEASVVRKFRTTATDGKKYYIMHYNLDVIISVGYRVNSIRGTQFRIWANSVLKDHLLKGYSINKRMTRIEDNVDILSQRVSEIDLQINTNLIPKQGIFFDGQIFDAHKLMSDIVRSAKKSIVLIDNYVDDTVLDLFSKKGKNVNCVIFTQVISKQLKLDADKFNQQYPVLELKPFKKAHDRFLIIDKKDVYHIGASLKDLGKKWFAFSKMGVDSVTVIDEIHKIL